MKKYQYQLLQYVHDQFTSEFGNVGIIVYSPEANFLECRVVSRYSRLSDFFGEINGHFLLASLRRIESLVNKIGKDVNQYTTEKGSARSLELITSSILPKDDSALQLTEVVYGIDLDPKFVLSDLFERIIERYNADDAGTRHTDHYVWSKVYKNYFDKYDITRKLKKHSVTTKKDTINFDKAWKNGVWNCYQALSLDLKTEDSIKSKVYKWSGIIRELETAEEKIHLYFLTSNPKEHEELTSFYPGNPDF